MSLIDRPVKSTSGLILLGILSLASLLGLALNVVSLIAYLLTLLLGDAALGLDAVKVISGLGFWAIFFAVLSWWTIDDFRSCRLRRAYLNAVSSAWVSAK